MAQAQHETTAPLLTSCHHLLQPSGAISGEHVARTILPLFPSLCAALLNSDRNALGSIDGRKSITHARIRDFVLQDFGPSLHRLGFGKGHKIAVVLPNGPELALSILAIANWATCVPLNANGALTELKADIERCQASVILGPAPGTFGGHSSSTGFDHVQELAAQLHLPFVGLIPSETEAGIFQLDGPGSGHDDDDPPGRSSHTRMLTPPASPASPRRTRSLGNSHTDAEADVGAGSLRSHSKPREDRATQFDRFLANSHDDPVLLLFTSGTTGSKKIVPHCLGDIMVAAAIISLSWNLTPSDVNCNLMPLFHVGGIVRQVFSPVLSGGCVICCPSFDPGTFWELLEEGKFTWYYAAPTMHQLLLQSKPEHILNVPPLRMIANAAGGLLPSLARQLRDTFQANVLPSYGMTECMPISSPPATYNLEKPGTSGVAVGPQVCILNTSTLEEMPHGSEGPICVRGAPCFRGYGRNALEPSVSREETFLEGGWFNTGDLGYMDEDGYLYITGRSKEVINRGGEIISPMEVEEAVLSHPDIKTCAAFSALHSVLQEVVGIVVVQHSERPRLDLQTLHDFLSDKLANPKWPQCLVFMDALPKSHTNKLLRVKLGHRLGLPELNDTMYPIERTFNAKCPRQGTPIHMAIPSEQVTVCPREVQEELSRVLIKDGSQQIFVVTHPSRLGALVCHAFQVELDHAIHVARDILHRYAVPTHFVQVKQRIMSERDLTHPKPTDSVAHILQQIEAKQNGRSHVLDDPLVQELQQLFQDLLDLDCLPSPETSFFNLGGSSMLASQLASRVRKRHGVLVSGAEVFHHSTCVAMASLIKEREKEAMSVLSSPRESPVSHMSFRSQFEETMTAQSSITGSTFNQKDIDTNGVPFTAKRLAPEGSFLGFLFQLFPLLVVFPIWQVSRYFLFFSFLLMTLTQTPGERNLIHFVVTLTVFHLLWVVVTPLIFVCIKWVVIGRYQPGRYALWGTYYIRWWFVDVCRKLFGRGVWGSNEAFLNFYYRLLGANIGSGARISLEADVAEYDLVTIGNFAAVEYSTVRGFGVDNGSMILGPVSVGDHASVGARSVVAPYTSVPGGGHLGPVTSSYEVGQSLDKKHARVNRRMIPEPSLFTQLFVGAPITFAVDAISYIPALLVVVWMLIEVWDKDNSFEDTSDLLRWLCDVRRIPYFFGIRLAKSLLSPMVYMTVSILIKWFVIGKFKPGPRDTSSQWQLLRHWLAASLFSRQNMQEVVDLFGRHYELVSCLYRILGAKVGKRVFWPGNQPVFTGEFELLEIGDDVVFGSRSSLFCTTVDSCEKVVLCAGSNVSDNCVVLPGSTLGKNAVLGSNSVCPEGWYLPEASVWFGSKGCQPVCLEKGPSTDSDAPLWSADVDPADLTMEGDDSTLRPFGKAFYNRDAPYFVLPLVFIVAFTWTTQAFITVFHTLPLLGALHGAAALLYGMPTEYRDYDSVQYGFLSVYAAILNVFFVTHFIRLFAWLALDLTAKWGFMGQRQEGRYNYDSSPYAQKWEMYQIVGRLRKLSRFNILDFICGTPFMTQYLRLNGAKIGKDCCLYPSGGDPYMPEPDLVTIGDRCVVDCSSIVCHLNTRGNFELAKIVIEDHVTLRSRSRIQQGVHMEAGSMLLEKSLAMTGEVIEADSVWQGAPASPIFVWSSDAIQPSTSFIDMPRGVEMVDIL